MRHTATRLVISAVLFAAISATAFAAPPDHAQNNERAIKDLKAVGGGTKVSVSSATGTANFVRLPPGLAAKSGTVKSQDETAKDFVSKHSQAFGSQTGSADLKFRNAKKDELGQSHLSYSQEYEGLPVFGASLKAHFSSSNELVAITGTLVPDIDVSTAAFIEASEAGGTAVQRVSSMTDGVDVSVRNSRLLVFREGLAKGVPGESHLAYEVEVGNGASVREFVYIDAHTGKYIDQITGTKDGLDRRAYDAENATAPGPNYPAAPFWIEGDLLPTGVVEADNMIYASKETYDLFSNAFGRDSFDDAGGTMDSVFNRGNNCPNASWNGVLISFCPGTTSDDVTAHEWGHAYTDYTDDLIYQWQPGALNESYSDVVGETVDLLNERQTDTPDNPREQGSCSAFTTLPPAVTINSPAAIAGLYAAGGASFGPSVYNVTADVVLVDDGAGTSTDACDALVNGADIAGNIALLDRGLCAFTIKVKNAQNAGAVGVIVADNLAGPAVGMSGSDPTIIIPSLRVTLASGNTIRSELGDGVNATLTGGAVGSDDSVLWLMGEDATALGGAIRDMANPNCYGNPGKVSDESYVCSSSDQGGVHSNSGVPNHAFALMVDGGTYNGQTISGIGLTKANHILFRAKTHYQGPATDFAGHADALELSCADLIGADLASLTDGSPSGEVISEADCDEVANVLLAVEMRSAPSQCGFEPLLAKNPPPLCENPSKSRKVFFQDSFENGDSSMDRWAISHFAVAPDDFTERDWSLVSDLPNGRAGRAFFGPDPTYGTCAPGGDESAVLHLDSPQITLPTSNGNLRVAFDHWVATEFGWDGANLKISVNDGPWTVVDYTDFVYNSYNIFLVSAANGNTNPMAGEQAFSGADEGSVSGSWGRSIVDLTNYALPKDKIRLRFDIGTDGCGGAFGWYVDDVSVYECR